MLLHGACSRVEERYLIGAYYYHWFPRNFNKYGLLRKYLVPPQEPVLGFYNSRDLEVAEEHISWCSQYGIDFLVLDWWPNRSYQNRAISECFLKASNIRDIKFCIFYETQKIGTNRVYGTIPWTEQKVEFFLEDIRKIAAQFFNNPSYLRIDNRPVIFLYLTRNFQGDTVEIVTRLREKLRGEGFDPFIIADEVFWKVVKEGTDPGEEPVWTEMPQRDRIRAFDAITAYNMYESQRLRYSGYMSRSSFLTEVKEIYYQYQQACGEDTVFIPNIIPGFNDRGVRLSRDHYAIPRGWDKDPSGGLAFSHVFDWIGLPFVDRHLPLLMITSWNEWNEDTAIEPLRSASTTSRDITGTKEFYTQGYSYSGFGKRYLEIIRNKVVAVSGRVLDEKGCPVPGEIVLACKEGRVIARDKVDSNGYYRLSRLKMPSGEYIIELQGSKKRKKLLVKKMGAIDVDFVIEK